MTRDWCSSLPGVIINSASATNGEPRNIITDNVRMARHDVGRPDHRHELPVPGGVTCLGSNGKAYRDSADLGADESVLRQAVRRGRQPRTVRERRVQQQQQPRTNKAATDSRAARPSTPRVPVERYSVFSHMNYRVDGHDEPVLRGLARRGRTARTSAPLGGSTLSSPIPIYRDNPYLPANVASIMDAASRVITSFRLGKHWDDWGRVESHSDNEVYRMVVGAER